MNFFTPIEIATLLHAAVFDDRHNRDVTTPPKRVAPAYRRVMLRTTDQIIFGTGMFIAMIAIVAGVVMLVESRGHFPYVLIGGVVLGAASLDFLRRASRRAGIRAAESDQ